MTSRDIGFEIHKAVSILILYLWILICISGDDWKNSESDRRILASEENSKKNPLVELFQSTTTQFLSMKINVEPAYTFLSAKLYWDIYFGLSVHLAVPHSLLFYVIMLCVLILYENRYLSINR